MSALRDEKLSKAHAVGQVVDKWNQCLTDNVNSRPCLSFSVMMIGAAATLFVQPTAGVALTLCMTTINNCLDTTTVVKDPLIRRCLKGVPYFPHLLLNRSAMRVPSLTSLAIALSPTIILHLRQRDILRITLNREICSLMQKETWKEKFGEAIFFTAPAVGQEMLHRATLTTALRGLPQPIASGVSGLLFAVEHIPGSAEHTALTVDNLGKWTMLGTAWGFAAGMPGGSVLSSIAAHILLNMPSIVQPFLRPSA